MRGLLSLCEFAVFAELTAMRHGLTLAVGDTYNPS
jgi:hypothetical protein